jgi:hypothetical protein
MAATCSSVAPKRTRSSSETVPPLRHTPSSFSAACEECELRRTQVRVHWVP